MVLATSHPTMSSDVNYIGGQPYNDDITGIHDEKRHHVDTSDPFPPTEWLQRLKAEYTGQHGGETLPAGCDPDRMTTSVLTLNEDEAVQVLQDLLISQKDDYTIDQVMLTRVRQLLTGHKACEMEQGEWEYEVCKRAGLYRNWSPYAEVRAVTLPYDDQNEACESFRAYILGYFWVCVCTSVNACKHLCSCTSHATSN